MPFALLERFRKDPIGVASQTPIVSFALEQGNESGGILKPKGGTTELFGLRGEARIAALDLVESSGTLMMKVDYKNPASKLAAGQDWMPFYFLPWIRNAIVRTTLRPRSQTTRAGVAKTNVAVLPPNAKFLIDQNNVLSGALDPNDPDIFITSAVNGCTVTVRGSREEPTVYHGNAVDVSSFGTKSPVELALAGRETDADGLITLKVADMQRMLLALETADPKADRRAGPHNATPGKMLTQSSYQMLAMQGKVAPGHAQAADTVVRGVAAQEGITKNKSNRVRIMNSQGTVFGVRTAGQWTFYYQKIVMYEIWHDTAGRFSKANWQRDASKPRNYRLVESGEFWPGGAGFVVP
jgi:hypothetical protein